MPALQKNRSHDGSFPVQTKGTPLTFVEKSTGNRFRETVDRTSRFRLLIIEDEPILLELYSSVLATTAFSVDLSSDGHDALEKLSSKFYDLVITDLNLPGIDGIKILRWIQRHRPSTTAVVISGDGSADKIVAAMRGGARDYLVKPFDLAKLGEMLDRWRQSQHRTSHSLVSSLMKQMMHDVRSEVLNLEITIKRLQQGKFDKSKKETSKALQTMQSKLEHMEMLTTEYCLLWKTLLQEDGHIQTEFLNLKEDVITPVLEEMQDALQSKEVGVAFQPALSVENDAYVQGNLVVLKFVFRNLFSNAIKNCQEASVIRYGIVNNDKRYKIDIVNEGPVIPAHMRKSIFDEFVHLPPENNSPQGNGLALSKNILRQHDGDIWYESIPEGSKLVCTLPIVAIQSTGEN